MLGQPRGGREADTARRRRARGAFSEPPTIPAGKLIDELGLKAPPVGGAAISEEHGNFIINEGAATARDVLELIEVIGKRPGASEALIWRRKWRSWEKPSDCEPRIARIIEEQLRV